MRTLLACAFAPFLLFVAPQAPGESLEELELALEFTPDDPALLARAARASLEDGEASRAHWYALLAIEQADADRKQKTLAKELRAFVAELGLPEVGAEEMLEAHAEEVFALAQNCQRKKLYANALDLLDACRGTRFEARAQERIEKMFGNKKAVAALLGLGVETPARPVTRKSPEEIARLDAKHSTWEDPHEVETKHYTILTNMGFEMAHSISAALEQMNSFYREVFQHKVRGGGMRRCVIKVYALRDEFDEFENDPDPNVGGFFVPLENRVATFDPRSKGRPLSSLWSTLFHESSHQFTAAVSTNLMPGWLNEGTASYFEGASLLPSGQVVANQIPDSRLTALVYMLGEGHPALEDVVTYFQPGSYDGSYYPFGWGLVYFIQNYENEDSERVYLPVYRDFMKTYTKGGKHDVLGRFVEYFVEKADQPGVESFEDFEERWRQWILDLGELHYGPPEQADKLLELARKQVANGRHDYARETLGRALDKRPDDARILCERAEVLLELEELDGAIFDLRSAMRLARAREDADAPMPGFEGLSAQEVAEDCLARITKMQPAFGKAISERETAFVAQAGEAATALVEAGFPHGAVRLLETSTAVLGGNGELAAMSASIRDEEDVDLTRWRRLPVDDELLMWEAGDDWSGEEHEIQLDSEDFVLCTLRGEMPTRYGYEVTIHPQRSGDVPVFGLVFGSNHRSGSKMFAILPKIGTAALVTLRQGPEIVESFASSHIKPNQEQYRLAIEIGPEKVLFYVDDHKVGEAKIPRRELAGRIGVFGQQGAASFFDLRTRY